jgi:hypothetical protein
MHSRGHDRRDAPALRGSTARAGDSIADSGSLLGAVNDTPGVAQKPMDGASIANTFANARVKPVRER